MKVLLPYGKEHFEVALEDSRVNAVLLSELEEYVPEKTQEELVREAMMNPIGTERLSELARGKEKVVIIASDHTRPVPSKIIMPLMLEEIRKYNPNADITILIATGCHRGMTKDELASKFTPEIMQNEKIVMHDCDETDMMVDIGELPSGSRLVVNKLAYEADLLVSEGFIEPHFFAGFSGGRKSVLPGVSSRTTVMCNHCSKFIDDSHARTGILGNNPIHEDMIYAAEKANLAFICNVVINSKKEVIYAVAGKEREAHQAGCEFLGSKCIAEHVYSDIVISTNGGYPLDQNIYQAVKGMTAAEATVKEGGVIIMLAKSNDGHGGQVFYDTFKNEPDVDRMMKLFLSRAAAETIPDQWQSQIFARILQRATVIYVSDCDDQMVRDLHMIPAKDVESALKMAEDILQNPQATITVIPDGVAVIVK